MPTAVCSTPTPRPTRATARALGRPKGTQRESRTQPARLDRPRRPAWVRVGGPLEGDLHNTHARA